MKLPTRVRYGCRTMVTLALHREEGPVPLEVLAEEQGIPERYLAKIVQDLRRSGLIRSVRGAHGGYRLSKPAAGISLLDVYEALEGTFCPVECLDAPGTCGKTDECVTRGVWEELRDAVVGVMRAKSLDELARQAALEHKAAGGAR
jgi:Rrf2 family cysteine metabolism transcriptional repressor